MADYSSIRGWLQGSSNTAVEIRKIIPGFKARAIDYGLSQEDANLYLQGFVFQQEQINWSSFVFYGADIRTSAVRFIEDLVKEIAQQVFEMDGNYVNHPIGLFHVNDESEDKLIIWLLANGKLDKKTIDYPFAEVR